MLTPIYNPGTGKLSVIGYASGSGDTLWKALELQKDMESRGVECPFEVAGVFASKKDAKAIAAADQFGVPCAVLDIKDFYKKRRKPLSDKDVRREFDEEALKLIRPMKAQAILLAGYVWATTDCLLDEYLIINVHPADLSIMKDGKRAYAGGDGVGAALAAKEPFLCSSAHLATRQVDGGPLLMISEKIPVDYTLHAHDEDRMRHYLKLVNEQSRLVGARTLFEVASGNFAQDTGGAVFYKGKAVPMGIRVNTWEENIPLYQREMDKLLYPDSVAVIGASQKPGIGFSIVRNITGDGFAGRVYAVNKRGEDVLSAKGYASVSEIPETVDLAIISTPGSTVLELAEECGQQGVKALVCISAGFKEIGGEGIAAQEKLVEIINRYNMRLIGPNCMGEMNVRINLNATILANGIAKGNVAMVTQSGSIGAAILDYSARLGIGFSSIVSLGNQADVTVCDLLPFYEKDEHTKVIVLYLETILDPARFWRLAAKVTKPILLLKAGSTNAGMAAASSHTGSLAGNDKVVDALIRKAGITRVHSLGELFLCASALANMPMVKGNRIGHLTNAGGPSILISDALANAGFTLPAPSDKLKAYLAENLLHEASVQNPVDIVAPAPPEHYALSARALIESGEYDALPICCVPPATVDTAKAAEALVPILKASAIPSLACFFGPNLGKGGRDVLIRNGIPVAEYPEQLAMMLAGMRKQERPDMDDITRTMADLSPDGASVSKARGLLAPVPPGQYVPTVDAYGLLALFGVTAAKNALLKRVDEASALGFSYPVVAKIDHPEIIHKSDVGGVRLNIGSAQALAAVVSEFLAKFKGANGVFVQEQVPEGIELIVGGAADPQLGPSVMVGLGGVWVEVMKDITFAYPPIGRREALSLIDSLKCAPLLSGYRGSRGVNRKALAALVCRIGIMLLTLPGITEIDLNPVIYDPARNTFVAADARIRKS
ncbi:MAG: acetate--CoA ligase family protein [Treponema sp.]|jgi:acetyltransferase|nr:acetate--CoA ligase family protein [Treponema sp.]